LLKDSDAAPKIATSLTPLSIAASNPLRFGVRAEYETLGIFFIPSITCLWSAIFGMDRKQTIKQE